MLHSKYEHRVEVSILVSHHLLNAFPLLVMSQSQGVLSSYLQQTAYLLAAC